MKRIWNKPLLIPAEVSRDREHIELFARLDDRSVPLVLLAPEVPVHADNGRINIKWLIGNSTAEEKKLRQMLACELDDHLLEKDDPCPWTTLVYRCYRSDDSEIEWTIEHSLPTAPRRPDWMFDDIADEELIACCLWEYGRESHTLGMAAADHWVRMRRWMKDTYAKDPELEKWHDKKQAGIECWLGEVGSYFDEFLDSFWRSEHFQIEIYECLSQYGGSSAEAWQDLSKEARDLLIGKVGKSRMLRPLAPASVGELERLWNGNNERLLQIRNENETEDDDNEIYEMVSETKPVELHCEDDEKPVERIAAAFTVDFSRFTDREILDTFRDWLKQQRPAQWNQPRRVFPNAPRRGRRLIDYRVALERLGLMRLLNDNYPDRLRKNHPEIWKRLCRDDTHFRRECQLACNFFHALFPFLPEDESPRSSKPVEVWEREIEDELARQKADGTLPAGE